MIEQQLSEAVQQVVDGYADPLEVFAYLKEVENHLKKCKEEIEEIVFIEAEKYEGKTFEHKGFKFTKTDGRAIYDFKHLSKWNELKEKLKEIEDKSKAAAKNVKIGAQMVTDDGEIIEPCIIKYSKPSISITKI